MSSPTDFIKNETLRSIHHRHSIRMFTDQEVRDEDIRTILDAANCAPSAHNQQSWRFLVLRGEKKHALAELVSRRAADFPRSASILMRMAARSIQGAPVVVAVANTGELIRNGAELFRVDGDLAFDFFRTMEIQSSAAAVENLLLAATSLGIGSVWLGILFLMKREVLEFLGEPAGEFMAVVPLGYPAKTTEGPKKRPWETLVRTLK
ncbi:MAG: nitroreductase family protein [Thermoguttaceae bacterium]